VILRQSFPRQVVVASSAISFRHAVHMDKIGLLVGLLGVDLLVHDSIS
jgi:hypothetical protein